MIGFSDLVDLWVIKIKMTMILCARSTSRSREQSTKRRSSSGNMWKVYSIFEWLSNMTHFFRNSRGVQRHVGFFPVLFGCWLTDCKTVPSERAVWEEQVWRNSLSPDCARSKGLFCGLANNDHVVHTRCCWYQLPGIPFHHSDARQASFPVDFQLKVDTIHCFTRYAEAD